MTTQKELYSMRIYLTAIIDFKFDPTKIIKSSAKVRLVIFCLEVRTPRFIYFGLWFIAVALRREEQSKGI